MCSGFKRCLRKSIIEPIYSSDRHETIENFPPCRLHAHPYIFFHQTQRCEDTFWRVEPHMRRKTTSERSHQAQQRQISSWDKSDRPSVYAGAARWALWCRPSITANQPNCTCAERLDESEQLLEPTLILTSQPVQETNTDASVRSNSRNRIHTDGSWLSIRS